MNKTVVYTCILNNYDTLKTPAVVSPNIDYICFTDDETLKSDVWTVIYIKRPDHLSYGLFQRFIKFMPHLLLKDYDISIYIDGNIIPNSDFTELFNELDFDTYNIFIPTHPQRDCTYLELIALYHAGKDIEKLYKYHDLYLEQYLSYQKEGFPMDYGLTQNNIIIRKHNDPDCIKLMDAWWYELNRFSPRDQTCLFYCIWKLDYKKLYKLPAIPNKREGDIYEWHITRDFKYQWAHN